MFLTFCLSLYILYYNCVFLLLYCIVLYIIYCRTCVKTYTMCRCGIPVKNNFLSIYLSIYHPPYILETEFAPLATSSVYSTETRENKYINILSIIIIIINLNHIKISTVKFSPPRPSGEVGGNVSMADITCYSVY